MPEATSDSVIRSVNSCLYSVIPSLFCFIVISKLITNSGIAYIISKPFGKIFTRLTGLPGIGFPVFLFSFLSGYPSGVIASCELYKNNLISKKDAEDLCAVSDNTGPALPVILLGTKLLESSKAGMVIYFIQIISSLTAVLILRKESTVRDEVYSDTYQKGSLEAVTDAVEGAIKSISIMCGYIILFNVLGDALITVFGNTQILKGSLPFIEIVSGCSKAKSLCSPISFILVSTALSFGGICVHMQAASVMSGLNLSIKNHFVYKLTQSLCAFIYSCLFVFTK